MNLPKEVTRGPWRWAQFGRGWMLVTAHSGAKVVLTGLKNAFLAQRDANGVIQALDPNHPDSRLIECAPELLMALHAQKDADDHVAACEDCKIDWCTTGFKLYSLADDRRTAVLDRIKGEDTE